MPPSAAPIQNIPVGWGHAPVTARMTAKNNSANGRPKRKRTCVAPTVPSVTVSPRWSALRNDWHPAAAMVVTIQREANIMSSDDGSLFLTAAIALVPPS